MLALYYLVLCNVLIIVYIQRIDMSKIRFLTFALCYGCADIDKVAYFFAQKESMFSLFMVVQSNKCCYLSIVRYFVALAQIHLKLILYG